MRTYYTILLLHLVYVGVCQTKVSGKITDGEGKPVVGANVFLNDTYDGASSSADGHFEFTTSESSEKMLVVKFIGYKDQQLTIELNGTDIRVDIVIEEAINELDAVMITAGAFTASDESRRTVFKALDIATTAGATADIAGALNTLPGTQKNGESGRLFVRGGDGNETRTFIDGMMVLDAYNVSAPNTPSRGRFLPFMFKGTSFSTGGYSSEYGQALSSALTLDSRDKAESTRTDIGLLSVGGDVAHTHSWQRASIAGKIQYTNIRPYFNLINQEIDWKVPPASIEGVAAYRQRVGDNGMFKFYGNFNHSSFSMYNHDIANNDIEYLYDLTNDYRYLNGSYKTSLNEKWVLRSGLSYSRIQNNTALDTAHFLEVEEGWHAKAVLDGSIGDNVELKAGGEVIGRNYNYAVDLEADSDFKLGFDEWITAGFAEADIYASKKLVARVGGRLEYNNLVNKLSIDPRLSLAYKTSASGQVSFAYGIFRQSPKKEWIRIDSHLSPERAQHFILNYQLAENNRTFRVETYYKRYEGLVKFNGTEPFQINNSGKGYAQGIELFWRDARSIRNVDYWLSYSYLDTERDYLNFPYPAVPIFASAHNLSLVYKQFIQPIRCQVGMTWSYTSGRPYNDPNTKKFNGSKTPYYADLSINVAYLPNPFLIFYVSCTNLVGRDNIFGYEFSGSPDANGYFASRAIRQPAARFLFIGVFITISKDKAVNQLPAL